MKHDINHLTEYSVKHAETRIGEFRRLRKLLLSAEYQTLIQSLEVIKADSFRVQTFGEISISLWNQPAFTLAENKTLFSVIEYITDLTGELPTSSDYPAELTRMYTWYLKSRGVNYGIFLHVSLAEDGVCKRVQTGTRTVSEVEYVEREVPEYQFVC